MLADQIWRGPQYTSSDTRMFISLFFLLIGQILFTNSGRLREGAYLFDFSPCPGVEMTSDVDTSFIYKGRDDYRLNIDWKINETVDNFSVILDIEKCPSRTLIDCEVYLRFAIDDFCNTIREEHNHTRLMFLKQLLRSAEPPIESCPLEGQYKWKDFPIAEEIPDVKKMFGFGFVTDNKIIKCDFSLTTGNDVLLCVRVVGSFRLIRKQ